MACWGSYRLNSSIIAEGVVYAFWNTLCLPSAIRTRSGISACGSVTGKNSWLPLSTAPWSWPSNTDRL